MKKNKQLTFIDLFAGIGGFHLALHDVGAKCVFVSEWDDPARQTYENNFKKIQPELFNKGFFAGDITKIDPINIPNFDIMCAGFPCQPFSISGKQKGFQDTRGTLFFNVLEIIKAKQPKVVFLENVKHLKHHDDERTFKRIQTEIQKAGYWFTETNTKVMNTADFTDIPQNRERIFMVALDCGVRSGPI